MKLSFLFEVFHVIENYMDLNTNFQNYYYSNINTNDKCPY